MTQYTPHTPSDADNSFDLNRIFIGREQQLDLFDIYLTRWQNLLRKTKPDDALLTTPPSPNNKLQGLIVLLYGRGGFGKSTLLKHFRDVACTEGRNIAVSTIVDWEFVVEGKRGLFNPIQDQEIVPSEYYRILCSQLAIALGKQLKDFKVYQAAVKDVENAHKQVSRVLDRLQGDDRYATLRGVTIDALTTLLGTIVPAPIGKFLDNEKVKDILDESVKIGGEVIADIYAKLRNELGNTLGDYLDAPTRLGLALGHDLHAFARNFPLLLFFDTYEEIDTVDRLLRIVMNAAGLRVGWILAGRDNLWGGAEQRKRSIRKEYGYKEIVSADRGLAIDFNVGGVGAFALSDIKDYFDLVCDHVRFEPPLPVVSEEQAHRILDVTQGVPLAVAIVAGLYLETADIELVTAKIDSKRKIVDQMVERYLLHSRDDLTERHKLYGLALLRRSDEPFAIAAALGLSEEEAKTSYESELSRLHRRYSFIFTEKAQPSLHQEVRYFLRLWLLKRYKDPEIIALNVRLKEAHEKMIKQLEERRQYTTLEERLQDDEWAMLYLDLTEQQFWLDPTEGVRYLLPFMIAAAIYRRGANKEAAKLAAFFEQGIPSSSRAWWKLATQNLVFITNRKISDQGLTELQEMVQLAQRRCPTFPSPLPAYREELEAALWWRLGEAYRGRDNRRSLEWYEKALKRLPAQKSLKDGGSEAAWLVAEKLHRERKYREQIPFLDKALELKPDFVMAYLFRGMAYSNQKDYLRAIEDFDRAIHLDPDSVFAYRNLGIAYRKLKEYRQAIESYSHILALDPHNLSAYSSRGWTYYNLGDYQHAIEDYNQVISLNPNSALAYESRALTHLRLNNRSQAIADYNKAYRLDATKMNAIWMAIWVEMGKQRICMGKIKSYKIYTTLSSEVAA
jgi:tetratricopeptide (TPR) repeat protein